MVKHKKKEITFLEYFQLVPYEAQTNVSTLICTNTETKNLFEIFIISVKYAMGSYLRQ